MAKIIVLVVMIFLIAMGFLAFFNTGTVELTVWKDVSRPIPVIALIFVSTSVGILSMFLIYTIRDARRYFEQWRIHRQRKKENKILDMYSKGVEAHFAGKLEDAGELFTNVLQSEPSHFNALLRMGDISFAKGEFDSSMDFYVKARDVKPRSIEVLLSLEKISQVKKKWPEALRYLDSILEIDDENIIALHKKREIHERNKKWEEVIEVQNKILKCKLSPKDEEYEKERIIGYKYELGRQYLEAGATDKAIKSLKSVIKTNENFAAAYIMLADAYSRDSNSKEAEDILLKGLEITQSLVVLAKLEDYYIEEGEPGTIIELYQKAVNKDRKNIKLQFFLAKLYYRLEMIDHALDTINSIDPSALDFSGIHTLLGNIYDRRFEKEKALNELKIALNIDKPPVVPFCCSKCNFTAYSWTGKCPGCNHWNTLTPDINETCENQKRQSSS